MWSHVVGVPVYLHSEPERSMLTGENTEPRTPQGIMHLIISVSVCTIMVVVRCTAFFTTDVQPEPLPPSQTQGSEFKDHDVPSWKWTSPIFFF